MATTTTPIAESKIIPALLVKNAPTEEVAADEAPPAPPAAAVPDFAAETATSASPGINVLVFAGKAVF